MIQENYYQGFVTLCKRNPKITRIPSKDELENAGCQLSGMCYLIEADGRQCNPAVVNPEILSVDITPLFIASIGRVSDEKSVYDIPVYTPIITPVSKTCVECGATKELQMFRKKANKIPTWFDTCIACQAKGRTKDLKELIEPAEDSSTTVADDNDEISPILAQFDITEHPEVVVSTQTNTTGYVHIDRVRELVTEAYAMGRYDEKLGIEIIEPTVRELLGITQC